MDSGHNDVPEREQRLDELVTSYLKDLEAGQEPNRQALLARHPDLAAELAQFFEDQDALGGLAARRRVPLTPASVEEQATAGSLSATEQLGDFRIVREVGRGGMGIVYEAEQLSLRRRVALKVLPFAGALDSRQLQRFQNEARAAGGLHHTNIVPVHFVGCERGVHFYAMQFIEGQTLAALIRQLRRPAAPAGNMIASHVTGPPGKDTDADLQTPLAAAQSTERAERGREYYRTVARWGVQAAEALDYAHQVGVVHRDVKPANLIVENRGQLWVTDFGLARIQSEASLTATGDLLGTLRYMSPEQALAKRVPIDHRTDVYSLGATLYELLTLRPVFTGTDRQELLRQIALDDPVPPRRLEPGVPAELQTIVLKALEKYPADRYATAQDLAEDLRRWLEDRPIQARRPSVLQRLRRWGRRHRAAVGAGALCLLVTLAVLAGSIGWVWRDRAARRVAAEQGAEEAFREAVGLQEQELWPEALTALRPAENALANLPAAADLHRRVQELHEDLEMGRQLQEAHLQPSAIQGGELDWAGADALYSAAFRGFGLDVEALPPEEVARRVQDRSIRLPLAAALDDWASVRRRLGGAGWQHLLRAARAADPDPIRDRLRDAIEQDDRRAVEALADSARVGDWPPATVLLLTRSLNEAGAGEQAEALLQQARQRHPADFWLINDLADTLRQMHPPRMDEAVGLYTGAVALRPGSAAMHNHLGNALSAQRRREEAVAEYREALRLDQDFAIAHYNLGNALREQGRLDGAIAEYHEALRIRKDLVGVHVNLGITLAMKHRPTEAVAELREAVRVGPENASAHCNLAMALKESGRLDEAIAECRKALFLRKDYPVAHLNLAAALASKGQLDEAITEAQESVRLEKDSPEAHQTLGVVLMRRGQLDEAVTEYRQAISLNANYRLAHINLGKALQEQGRLDEAIAEFREAVRIKEDDGEAHCSLGLGLLQQGRFPEAVEELRLGHGLGSRNKFWPFPSAQWLRDAERLADLDRRLPELLDGRDRPKGASECLGLAQLCQLHKQLFAAAARWYGEAFDEQPALADDLTSGNRYNAACAAALAGCGQGKDADRLGDEGRARLRRQALAWLRSDLETWAGLVEKEPTKAGPTAAQTLQHWLVDPDLAGVRGEQALAKLPEAERGDWQKLWQEVEALRQRAARPPHKAAAPRP